MPANRLTAHAVAKPWGRTRLWPGFADFEDGKQQIGEIWFEPPPGVVDTLLVKYLFTSEALSIQVHPGDEAAQAAGHRSGKEEAWIILAAEPGATIGLGLTSNVSAERLRQAACDGSIIDLVDWRPVMAGDVIPVPPGTIHAIGAGITLVEVQQNIDLTYRLFDYGRPRPLHLDEAMAVAICGPYAPIMNPPLDEARTCLCRTGSFDIIELAAGVGQDVADGGWLIAIAGGGTIEDHDYAAGQCWRVTAPSRVAPAAGSRTLLARSLRD